MQQQFCEDDFDEWQVQEEIGYEEESEDEVIKGVLFLYPDKLFEDKNICSYLGCSLVEHLVKGISKKNLFTLIDLIKKRIKMDFDTIYPEVFDKSQPLVQAILEVNSGDVDIESLKKIIKELSPEEIREISRELEERTKKIKSTRETHEIYFNERYYLALPKDKDKDKEDLKRLVVQVEEVNNELGKLTFKVLGAEGIRVATKSKYKVDMGVTFIFPDASITINLEEFYNNAELII